MDSLTTLAAGAAAGGIMQTVSEGITFVSGLVRQQHEALMAQSAEGREWLKAQSAEADAAAQRAKNAGWLTSTTAMIVISVAFIGSMVFGLFAAFPALKDSLVTSIVTEDEGWSVLWGLFSSSPSIVVTEAKGWVQGTQWQPTIEAVIGFIFGIKGVKTVKRLF